MPTLRKLLVHELPLGEQSGECIHTFMAKGPAGGDVLDIIRNGVLQFRNVIFPQKRELYESLAEKQVPMALFLTCGDSRIDPSALTGTEPGQIFVERTPGNIVPTYDEQTSVGVSASIEYAVSVLGVQEVIVCGHSACGAMKGLLHPEYLQKTPATSRWLKYAEPALHSLRQRHSIQTELERLRILCQLNVVEQLGHLRTHPAIRERMQNGSIEICGWYYEIHTGTVEAYDATTGEFELWPPVECIT